MREARLYFQDILQACDYILEFTARQSFDEFRSDAKTRSAVERQFEIIGEASRQLPGEYRDRYAQIPWRQISGMRNIIAHAYFGITSRPSGTQSTTMSAAFGPMCIQSWTLGRNRSNPETFRRDFDTIYGYVLHGFLGKSGHSCPRGRPCRVCASPCPV